MGHEGAHRLPEALESCNKRAKSSPTACITTAVLVEATKMEYPKDDKGQMVAIWEKQEIQNDFLEKGDIPLDTFQDLQDKYGGGDGFLFIDGVIDSRHWADRWRSEDPTRAIRHSNNEWMHCVAVSLNENKWYEKQGKSADGWRWEERPAAHTSPGHVKLPIIVGEPSARAKAGLLRDDGLDARGGSGRYFRRIHKVFLFVPPSKQTK